MDLGPWIWSVNVERRHLTKEQIAFAIVARRGIEEREAASRRMAAGKASNNNPVLNSAQGLIDTKQTQNPQPTRSYGPGKTHEVLAREAGVSQYQIRRAMTVQKAITGEPSAFPDLMKQVAHGEITAAEAEIAVGGRDYSRRGWKATTDVFARSGDLTQFRIFGD